MRAVDVVRPGPAESMALVEMPIPTPASGQVLIQVHAAGVNRPDLLQRSGAYPPPPGALPGLGLEVSGVVVSAGEGVDPQRLGSQVMALTNGGGYAQYVAVPAGQCMAIPQGMSFSDAACIPETHLTVWQNLTVKGQLQAGHHVLIHGGSSGIGAAAIHACKRSGAIAHVTVGTQAKADFCRNLGASYCYLYPEQSWSEQVLAHTGGQGADLILDMVAGPYLSQNLDCLRIGGKVLVIALLGGRVCTIDAAKLLMKQANLTGTLLRPQPAEVKAALCRAVEADIAQAWQQGCFTSALQRQFSLTDVVKAHQWLESGQSMGKTVLEVTHDD